MSALITHSHHTQMGCLSQGTISAFGSLSLVPVVLAVFSALLPQAFLQSGMSAPTSFSNFAALAYCLKALAWVCTVASFQLQTYLLRRFSLFLFRMSATALTLGGRKTDQQVQTVSVQQKDVYHKWARSLHHLPFCVSTPDIAHAQVPREIFPGLLQDYPYTSSGSLWWSAGENPGKLHSPGLLEHYVSVLQWV